MVNRDLDEYSEEPLTDLEYRKVRRMLEEHDRAHWLWGFLVKCVIAAGSIAGAVAAVKTFLSGYIQWR